ncbi:MAG: rod shape-determining protein MreC [Chloroflexota bacterium]|nr:rod shape-determining protein MreC [Chloroflexota bacterium]
MKRRFPGFLRNTILSLLIIGALALALGGYIEPLSRLALAPIVTAQTWTSKQYQGFKEFLTAPRDVTVIRQQNAKLSAENARLQAQIVEIQQQLTEYEILSALLDFARAHPTHQYLGATVIGRDPSPFLHYVIINRGSDDGLRRGMPVVTQNGLAGRIAQVSAKGARVELITDPSIMVNVRIQPSRSEAVLTGSITGDIVLEQIPQDADVFPGNLILTSGLGGNYPPNIIVGQVTSVKSQEYALFQSASVQPVTDFSKLEIVLVITNFNPVEIEPLIPVPETP